MEPQLKAHSQSPQNFREVWDSYNEMAKQKLEYDKITKAIIIQKNWKRHQVQKKVVKKNLIQLPAPQFKLSPGNALTQQLQPVAFDDGNFIEVFQLPELTPKVAQMLKEKSVFDYGDSFILITQNIYQFSDGSVYIGEMEDLKKEGRGRVYLPNGSMFEGFWKDGMPEGRGRYFNFNGDYCEGTFKKGELHGQGRYEQQDGTYFEGEWKNNKLHGNGKESYKDGSAYEGHFRFGKKEGKGRFVWTDGSVYEGDLKANCLDGQGTLKYRNGKVYIG